MALIDDTRALLADLIAFPTVSADSNLDLISYAADRLAGCGARISIMRDETGRKANLFATIGPDRDGGIVLSGHTDVVPVDESEWRSDPFVMREADGLLYGRGACDMKGFIAAALAMAPRYAGLDLTRPVHFAFTFDEEVGCLGARQLVEELERMEMRPSVAIIGEPTEMRIIEGHKGCYEYTTEFTGLEGHGSLPDAGVNAIEYAVRYVTRLMELGAELKTMAPAHSPFDPPWTTLQVGRIEGGSARNVIAGHCAVEWEMRPVRKSDADHVKRRIGAYCEEVLIPAMRAVSPAAGIRTQIIGEVEGLEPASESEARAIVAELTGANTADVVSFGTEAGLFQSLGISTVVCGPGSIAQAHKPDEFISIKQLQACIDMLTGLEGKLTGQARR
ncbi:MAG: acetylornithine deacetylase [Notoacmeibacter sp.]|nr:acetylornithine deacetylase [Notoacmeibacter sp.]